MSSAERQRTIACFECFRRALNRARARRQRMLDPLQRQSSVAS